MLLEYFVGKIRAGGRGEDSVTFLYLFCLFPVPWSGGEVLPYISFTNGDMCGAKGYGFLAVLV